MERIPEDQLCKTFQDAIEIAKTLGFSWLWIDSLFIIQRDDEYRSDHEDWLKDSALMASTYGNSSLNIASMASPDGRKGCLFKRNPTHVEKHQVEVNKDAQTYDI